MQPITDRDLGDENEERMTAQSHPDLCRLIADSMAEDERDETESWPQTSSPDRF